MTFLFLIFVGCTTEKQDNTINANYISIFSVDDETSLNCSIVNSKEQLYDVIDLKIQNEESFSEEYSINQYIYPDKDIYEVSMINKTKKYDDVYFEDKSLIVFENIEESSQNDSIIKSYKVEKEVLTINIETINYGEILEKEYYYYILELDTTEIQNVKDVKVIKNNDIVIDTVERSKELEKIENKIIDIYADYHTYLGNYTKEDIEVIYYFGQYDDSHVAIINFDEINLMWVNYIHIGGLWFNNNVYVISVYNNDTYYTLQEASKLNIISNNHIMDIYIQFNAYLVEYYNNLKA